MLLLLGRLTISGLALLVHFLGLIMCSSFSEVLVMSWSPVGSCPPWLRCMFGLLLQSCPAPVLVSQVCVQGNSLIANAPRPVVGEGLG